MLAPASRDPALIDSEDDGSGAVAHREAGGDGGLTPPLAERRPMERTHHGDTVIDHYDWLREPDDPAVLAYLQAENAYCDDITRPLAGLRDRIVREITARTQLDDVSVPELVVHEDGRRFWYYTRTLATADYPVYCRLPVEPGDDPSSIPDPTSAGPREQVLLDCNAAAGPHDFFFLGAFDISPDGRLLAWSADTTGDERYDLAVVDLETGRRLPDALHGIGAGVTWLGNDQIFYTRLDGAWRAHEVWRHEIGAAVDALVVQEPDQRFSLWTDSSRDEQWLLVGWSSTDTSQVGLITRRDPAASPRLVAPAREGVDYSVEVGGDRLFVLHNADEPDFELAEAPLNATSHEQWRSLMSAPPGGRLRDLDAYAGHVVVGLLSEGMTSVWLIDRDAAGDLSSPRQIDFGTALREVSALPGPNWDAASVRLSFTSLVTPRSTLDCDLATGQLRLLKRTPVLDDPAWGPYAEEDYLQERRWAAASDGTRVPVSIVRRRDVPLDGSAPCLLVGYGAYELCYPPQFSIPRLSLLQRGVIYAIAHVRGGGELGRRWYEAGRRARKVNTFSDFVDVARFLVAAGYTSPGRLAVQGGSAGGLLMGAVANLAPDLFCAIHADVAFVDPLTTMLDPEMPLTVNEWEEWGDPLHDPAAYRWMKGYSPYENLRATDYPAILATAGLHDTRVSVGEPAKWVANLRTTVTNPSQRPILLKVENAGHAGVSGRSRQWEQDAFELAWLLDRLDAADAAPEAR